jgi:hypothetical protein
VPLRGVLTQSRLGWLSPDEYDAAWHANQDVGGDAELGAAVGVVELLGG